MKINLELLLKSPLLHFGDERMGTMQVARTMKFKVNEKYVDIPVFSGNAFRGELRRIAMNDYLKKLEIKEEGISAKLYYTLFTGGTLTSGSRFTEIAKKREMRRMCPPLSLFGTAIGDQIPEGKLKVSIFKPICKELNEYNNKKSEISFYEMLQDIFYTRRDDLKSKDENIKKKKKNENAQQMKYEAQCLSAGTILEGSIIIENSNEMESSCLYSILENFRKNSFIGGKSSTGHGEVKVIQDINGKSDDYYKFLEENKEEIINWLRRVESEL